MLARPPATQEGSMKGPEHHGKHLEVGCLHTHHHHHAMHPRRCRGRWSDRLIERREEKEGQGGSHDGLAPANAVRDAEVTTPSTEGGG